MAAACVDGAVIAHRYAIIRELGSGAFGKVYLVTDSKSSPGDEDEQKALKVVNISSVAIPDPVQVSSDTLLEARIQRDLNHPCVVRFFESFSIKDKFYMCTEFCEGGDLDEKIQSYKNRNEMIKETQIAEWLIQMILGLRHIHKQNILHRDIKPKNLLLRNDIIKIADFGISKEQQTTLAHTCIGTPHYMSPEAVTYNGYNDKSDVWAVGCIIYELAAQRPLFDGPNIFQVFKQISSVSLGRWPRGYSQELQKTFEKIMVADPKERPSVVDVQRTPYIVGHMDGYNTRLRETLTAAGTTVPPTPTRSNSKENTSAIQKARDPNADKKDSAQSQFWAKTKESESKKSKGGRGKLKVVVSMDDPNTMDMQNLMRFIKECSQDDHYVELNGETLVGRDETINTVKMRTQTLMGKRSFNKAYLYLKKARSVSQSGSLSETEIDAKMRELAPDHQAREYLDHLVSLEIQTLGK